jgi:hypothetical protein
MDIIEEKMMKKVFSNGDCWIWMGTINKSGQPHVSIDGVAYSPHFYLYEKKHGEVGARYLDSSCGNIRCVNPEHRKPRTLENRLLSNVAIDEQTGCWNWTGSYFKSLYGRITIDGKNALAHRVSYGHFYGEIPDGLFVCHSCNNKRCINPRHLYVGTINDNARDAVLSGDTAKGENNGMAILTREKVVEIKRLIKSRQVVYRKIAEIFGVSRQAIKDIASGRTWSWVEEE